MSDWSLPIGLTLAILLTALALSQFTLFGTWTTSNMWGALRPNLYYDPSISAFPTYNVLLAYNSAP